MALTLASGTDLEGLPGLVGEYRRRRPEATPLYQMIQENYQTFVHLREEENRPLPAFVRREFERFLNCGQLSEGFLRLRCQACGYDRLVAFSCKCRGWCPSCVGRRMNDGAAFLTDRLIGDTPFASGSSRCLTRSDTSWPTIRSSWARSSAPSWERCSSISVFQCPRCHAHGMQRIATIVDHDVVRRILRAVGLPTDPPTSHPPRSVEELFVD